MITKKYYKLIRVSHADSEYFRITNVSNESGVFSVTNNGTATSYPSMEYSLDGINWTTYDFSTLPTITVGAGNNIYLRGDNANGFQNATGNANKYFSFSMNVSHSLGGCIMTLRSKNSPETVTIIKNRDFEKLFYNDTNLVSAGFNIGNATTIETSDQNGSFYRTFYGCTNLIDTPDFSSLVTINRNGFYETFYLCSSLTAGPDFSGVTTVGSNAFNSCFSGCTHISNVTAPNVQDLTQNNVLGNWLGNNAGTQATGTKTVRVPTGATITTGSTSGIPTGWTRVDY